MALVKFKRLLNAGNLPLPSYTTPGAAGMDVRAAEDYLIKSGERAVVKTGFAVEIPERYEIQVRSRSGLAAKHGVFVLNSPGTIDSDYRGEVMVILQNSGSEDFEIKRGDRVAQLVVAYAPQVWTHEVDELPASVRDTGGLGSTGLG